MQPYFREHCNEFVNSTLRGGVGQGTHFWLADKKSTGAIQNVSDAKHLVRSTSMANHCFHACKFKPASNPIIVVLHDHSMFNCVFKSDSIDKSHNRNCMLSFLNIEGDLKKFSSAWKSIA